MEIEKKELDLKIEKLLYFRNGLLSAKEYLEIISNVEVVWVKYDNDDNFQIKTKTGNYFKFKVYKSEK